MKITDTRRLDRVDLSLGTMGFGGAPIGNFLQPFTDPQSHEMVTAAWELGTRFFDTAPLYGHGLSEHRMGMHYAHTTATPTCCPPRSDEWLTPRSSTDTQLGPFVQTAPFTAQFDYSYDGVMRSVEQSMARMITDHFDILFIHDCDRYTHGVDQPEVFRQALSAAYPALKSLRSQGVVKAIGFGVNEADVCYNALKNTDADCFLLAGRYTLLEQEPLDDLLPACQEAGVGLILGGVYNSGILATGPIRGARFNYAPAPPAIRKKAAQIERICTSHQVPLPAAALQFAIAHPAVVSVCIGARNLQQQQTNADLFDMPIPVALWSELRDAGLVRPDAVTPN